MDYTSTAKAQEMAHITRKEMISHFANAQKNNQSGIIDKYYNYWANRLGINSIQCRRLAELFSAAVDAPKTGQQIRIPVELKPPRKEEEQQTSNNQITTMQAPQGRFTKFTRKGYQLFSRFFRETQWIVGNRPC
jgi:hypothetical protein